MNTKRVKDLMVPIDEYAVVAENATLAEALKALDSAQKKLPAGKPPHRAVLVKNAAGKVVGKLGHHGFLEALEPKYHTLGDVDKLSRAGVSREVMDMMRQNFSFWQDDLDLTCRRAHNIRIKDVMKTVEYSIEENASLAETIHLLIMWQVLSLLVTRDNQVVGILRLSDLFAEIAEKIKQSSPEC